MNQELHQRFYPYHLPSQECCEAGTVICRLQMKGQRLMGVKLFANSPSWQAEELGLILDSLIPELCVLPSWHQ